ncbi:NTP transferase domain-containing protein [Spongisporangium articulatum]|uniref:NTP transferase domain-containing protein n=1 Tax=Spongisporangium articulatum TaxID=3362603 RepID=A0ABW8AQE7_9ACTN
MTAQVIILAAGMGTRLGRPHPKPLTKLETGQTIMAQQFQRVRDAFGPDVRITVIVGFKMDLIMEAHPDALFVYNEVYSETNTSKSLLKGLRSTWEGGVLWMNGDVVFDKGVLEGIADRIGGDQSFVCVNTASVAEEEVKYTLGGDGFIDALSKQVVGGLGEAVGINYISERDKAAFVERLAECDDQDYFERGLELAIERDGVRILPVDISEHFVVEVDFEDDLARANQLHG